MDFAVSVPPTKASLSRHLRAHIAAQFFDESGIAPQGFAIYTLSDPRDLRAVRYVGQTNDPQRRFLQHLNTARLWLPAEKPWWIKSPKLRPLYEWIRELYGDGQRMPAMVVSAWVDTQTEARLAERARIYELLGRQTPLLNVEAEILGQQIPLL